MTHDKKKFTAEENRFCKKGEVVFKALSDENRVKILLMLCERPYSGCEFLDKLNIAQSTLSHHLKILTDSGLIDYTKSGRWREYSLNQKTLSFIAEFAHTLGINA